MHEYFQNHPDMACFQDRGRLLDGVDQCADSPFRCVNSIRRARGQRLGQRRPNLCPLEHPPAAAAEDPARKTTDRRNDCIRVSLGSTSW